MFHTVHTNLLFHPLKLVYEELLERAKEKEEKEAKKRQRVADDFTNLLHTFKVHLNFHKKQGWIWGVMVGAISPI